MPVKNETGNKYGSLTVISRGPNDKYGSARWYCQCDCGKQTLVVGTALRNGTIRSCGCSRRFNKQMNDLTNMKFGRLTALCPTERRSSEGQVYWKCQCECGAIVEIKSGNLVNGYSKSCGCLRSRGEENIYNILKANNIPFEREKSFDNLKRIKRIRFDFAILNDNKEVIRLIEFDGVQHSNKSNPWYSENLIEADQLKNEYALNNNIPLVRIPYKLRDKITLEDILSDKWLIK